MTRSDDERSNPPLTGDGAQTGFEATDVKDHHQVAYTTTPGDDRVGSSDSEKYTPVELPSAKTVTGTFDHLATRDVGAMEHAAQTPDFAGAETVEGLGGDVLDEVAPSAGVGIRRRWARRCWSASATSTRIGLHPAQQPGAVPRGRTGRRSATGRDGGTPERGRRRFGPALTGGSGAAPTGDGRTPRRPLFPWRRSSPA
ncbi:hypothetical protein ACFOUS_16790 [Deinococcus metalli]|uniref:hypothetical protein n=1 Tax=Deinococcus metalli TaxID=1141878 RepID=UPI0036148CD4